jgi:hypothetical protein
MVLVKHYGMEMHMDMGCYVLDRKVLGDREDPV